MQRAASNPEQLMPIYTQFGLLDLFAGKTAGGIARCVHTGRENDFDSD